MADELPCLGTRRRETHAVNDVVEPRFEHPEQVLSGRAFDLRRLLVIAAELPLEHAVHAAQLLLLAQLHAIVREPRTPLTGAAGRHFELALLLERLQAALQEQVRAFATGKLAGGSSVSSHDYTRRFFGGRQPLWGIGVTSSICVMRNP